MEKARISIQIHRPGINEILFFLLSGAIVSVPLTIFIDQYFAGPLLTGLPSVDIGVISVAIVAPFVEEFSKVFPLGYRHGETQRSIFSLAIFVGLGFGIVEFITYVVTYGPQIIPARIPGLFFHPASTSITAYGLATKRPLPFYLAAVGLHFANNFLAVFAPVVAPSSVIVLAVTLLASWKLHSRTKEVFIQNDDVCTC
jgi:RsiW-degrading membrane proteinase PrsW (M82 family)